MDDKMAQFDKDGTSELSTKEFELYQKNQQLEATLQKQDAQRKMAWTAIIVIIGVTGLLFHPSVGESRIGTIIPMLDWFYIAMASIPGAFMGMTAWMSKK